MSFRVTNLQIKGAGWVEFNVNGHKAQAKVYEEDSEDFGIDGGNISKLWIRDVYNYDRGLDFDRAPQGMIDGIVEFFAVGGEGYSNLRSRHFFG